MNRSTKGQQPKRQRKFVSYAVAIVSLTFLLLTLFSVERSTPTPFEEATADPQIRQEFIDWVLERFPLPPNVKRVTYGTVEDVLKVDPNYQHDPLDHMVITGLFAEGQEAVFEIFVLPRTFSGKNVENNEDFTGVLLHEYDHARLFKEQGFETLIRGFVSISEFQFTEFNRPIVELYAIQGELQRVTKSNSSEYRKAVEERYMENYLKLWNIGRTQEESLISDLKVEFFPLHTFPITVEEITDSFGITDSERRVFKLTSKEIEKLRYRVR